MATIFDIADWFLCKESMTHIKLQKLCYYFFAWGHALFRKDLVENCSFEAWIHGPVNFELYEKYKNITEYMIPKNVGFKNLKINENSLDLLESVWLTYGEKSGNELEALTHDELPWINARKGLSPYEKSRNIISTKDMEEYYYSIYLGKENG